MGIPLRGSWWEMGGKASPCQGYMVEGGEMREGVGDLLKGTDPSAVDLGTELWNPGSLIPGVVHVA